jgi:hypothetical protein
MTSDVHARYNLAEKIARDAGIDTDAHTREQSRDLLKFFDSVVEQCAEVAEKQARVYTGEHNEGNGCIAASAAIRSFGKGISKNESVR